MTRKENRGLSNEENTENLNTSEIAEEKEFDEEEELPKMTFLDHLEELRTRLIRSLIYIAVGAVVAGFFWEEIFKIILVPAGIKKLTFLSPIDAFMVKFRLALYAGLILATPLIVYEILAFVAPALTRREKKVALPIIILTVLLFYSGIAVGYYFILPPGTRWLLAQGGDVMEQMITADRYINYAMMFLAGVGASFEVPIVIWVLAKLGLVTPASLVRGWRYAFIIIFTAAALLTPDWSPVTMGLFAAPMIILYFLSIILIKII